MCIRDSLHAAAGYAVDVVLHEQLREPRFADGRGQQIEHVRPLGFAGQIGHAGRKGAHIERSRRDRAQQAGALFRAGAFPPELQGQKHLLLSLIHI